MNYSVDEISNEVERKIITGLVVSDTFCREAIPVLKPVYFKTNYAKKIFQWIVGYHKRYKKAPQKNISSIFQSESIKMKSAEAEIAKEFLQGISDQYAEERHFNKDYLVDQTLAFCKLRSLEMLRNTIDNCLIENSPDKGDEAVRKFTKVIKETSKWIDPFDEKEIAKTLDDDKADNLFRLPGALGEMVGWLKRGWLVSVVAPMKRGKSFMAWEFGYRTLTSKLKTAIFSFEMNETTYKKRVYKRMTAMADFEGEYLYPVFDCYHNQDGSCEKPERKNKTTLLKDDVLPKFSEELKYRPCDYCRHHREDRKFYRLAFWYGVQKQKESLNIEAISKKVKVFKKIYGSNLRIMCFPAFSGSFDMMINALDNLEYAENFVPDVLVIDYVDITAPELDNVRDDIGRKWQRAKNIAATRKILVINCDQSNRASIDQKNVKHTNTSENIMKTAAIDAEFTINQTEEEKERGVMRFAVLLHRHDESTEKGQTFVLQQLKLGQPFLDSEWVIKGDY